MDQGDGERGAIADLERILMALGVFICLGQDVCDLNRSQVDDGTCRDAPAHKRGKCRIDRGNLPMVRDNAQTIANYLKDRGIIRIAQARCGLDQRIEHFLHVEGRPADDLQNISGGRLLFQAFC